MSSRPTQRASLEGKLKALDDKSGIQFVVATVSSLDGEEIEPYANELFRLWKLGEAKKNNGLLFLIAPKEHKVRFEVGYGLEGTLTDAIGKIIIANAVAPRFKAGDFDGGIARGVDDAITTLTTDSSEWQKPPQLRAEEHRAGSPALAAAVFPGDFRHHDRLDRSPPGRHRPGAGLYPDECAAQRRPGRRRRSSFGGSSGGGSSDSGFSGGGGSSGGGGASGSW